MAIANLTSQFGISSFTVSSTPGVGTYSTIQTAVTAAQIAGAQTVYIYPGTYNESISWPAGVNIQGNDSGTQNSNVIITGTQTASAAGQISFRNIQFNNSGSAAGNVWTISNALSVVHFTECFIVALSGTGAAFSMTAGSLDVKTSQMTLTSLTATTLISVSGGLAKLKLCQVISTANTTAATVTVGALGSFDGTSNEISAGTSGSCIAITSATATVNMIDCRYISGDSTFNYTAAGSVISVLDSHQSSAASGFVARTTGPGIGTFLYSLILYKGTATQIDPNLTQVAYPDSVPPSNGLTWNNNATSSALAINNGYIITAGVQTFTLPAVAAIGSVIEMILLGGTSWTITISGAQSVNGIGGGGPVSLTTSVGSNDTNNTAMRLVCTTANIGWNIDSLIGTLTGS